MLTKPLEKIDLSDLQSLVTEKVSENKRLEFKEEMYRLDADNDDYRKKQRIEFLKDVSAFANTQGGDLVIGIEEDDGCASKIVGIDVPDFDGMKLQLSQLMDKWLEPRLSCAFHQVPVGGGKLALILRINRSLLAPHRVIYANQFGQFHARNQGYVYEMDTSQLRQIFTLTETALQQISSFSKQRGEEIKGGLVPIRTSAGAKLICHIIPLESFAGRISFTPQELEIASHGMEPLGSQLRGTRFNLDGIVISNTNDFSRVSHEYVQVYRNGIIEIVSGDITYTHPNDSLKTLFYQTCYEDYLTRKLPSYLNCLKALGIPLPIYFFLTLQGVKGVKIHKERDITVKPPFDRDCLVLPNVEIDDYGIRSFDLLLPLFNMIWNAGGHRQCLSFDENGNWIE